MRTASSISLAAAATLFLGCSDTTGPSTGGPGESEPSSFQVTPSMAFLQPNQSMQFAVTYSGNRRALAGGPGRAVWQSADESVASVSPGGLVRAVTSGKTRIVASWAGYQATALVTVMAPMKKHDGHPVCIKRTIRTPARLAQCAQ
jgi:Bacterial Ig-like domain (group 2)